MQIKQLRNRRMHLRFYALQDITYGHGSCDFDGHLKMRVMLFYERIKEGAINLPLDPLITRYKMESRIEKCCLLFKRPDRILQALKDLQELGLYAEKLQPMLMPTCYTQSPLRLIFDLDHVFLLDYIISYGRVIHISGFHSDYLNEIELLGNSEFHRLKISKMGIKFMHIEEAS